MQFQKKKNDWSCFRIAFATITNALSLETISYKYGHNSNIPMTILPSEELQNKTKKNWTVVNNLNKDTKKPKLGGKNVTQSVNFLLEFVSKMVAHENVCVVSEGKKKICEWIHHIAQHSIENDACTRKEPFMMWT